MSHKKKYTSRIISHESLTSNIKSMWIDLGEEYSIKPGQFINVFTNDKSKLLPRPISICEVDSSTKSLRLVYRYGETNTGTYSLSTLQKGDKIHWMGPFGNGFPVDLFYGANIGLIGGGIGIPPFVQTAKELEKNESFVTTILGYQDEVFLTKELQKISEVHIATDSGSTGVKGNVIQVMESIEHKMNVLDVVFACGPKAMLSAVSSYAKKRGIPCYISLEERMACGIGACLSCVCDTTSVNQNTGVTKARICVDGPVFLDNEIAF